MLKNKVLLATYFGNNYGSLLQAFSLQLFLNKNGYRVTILEEKPFFKGQPFFTILHLIKIILLHPFVFKKFNKAKKIANEINISQTQKEYYQDFRDKYLSIKYISFSGAKKESLRDDVAKCICGSDQIWNGEVINFKRFYFLSFSKKELNISYAPSFGRSTVAKYNLKLYTKMITNFSLISLREPNSFIKDATIVCDPTLLFTKDEWLTFFKKNELTHINKKYILVYLLDKPNQKCRDLLNFYKSRRENIIVIGHSIPDMGDFVFIDPNVESFPSLFFGADKIITDSYHGCIFSIIGEKQFIFIERNYTVGESQNLRFKTLFNKIGVELVEGIESKIDYTSTTKKLNKFRKESIDFLLRGLNDE